MIKLRRYAAFRVIAIAMLISGPSVALAAKYYKWVDEDGVTHYSAQPPAAGKGEVIKVRSGASSDKDTAMKKLEEQRAKLQQDIENRDNPKTDEQKEIEARNNEIVKRNCEIHRQNLKVMTESGRVRVQDENGESVVLPEEKRQARMKEAREYIQKNCS
ncbi:MAG: DUF4124 domain-containing protein [Pseudomonadales bacterium]|nr:DUF4124 domain-containing protein [Pseudomonadales bacterium]